MPQTISDHDDRHGDGLTARRDAALAELAADISRALGVTPLPAQVVERAAADSLYLHTLVGRRDDAEGLTDLIAAGRGPLPKWAPPANATLIARAATALARWAAAGFGEVDAASRERRRAACRRCPHLTQPGSHLLLALSAGREGHVCGLCSCAVDHKTALPTESCPAPDPDDAKQTRWGEPSA